MSVQKSGSCFHRPRQSCPYPCYNRYSWFAHCCDKSQEWSELSQMSLTGSQCWIRQHMSQRKFPPHSPQQNTYLRHCKPPSKLDAASFLKGHVAAKLRKEIRHLGNKKYEQDGNKLSAARTGRIHFPVLSEQYILVRHWRKFQGNVYIMNPIRQWGEYNHLAFLFIYIQLYYKFGK